MNELAASISKTKIPQGANKIEFLKAIIIDKIQNGILKPDDKMPSQRSLAKQSKIDENIIKRCYNRLTEEGLLVAKTGSGTYVTMYALSAEFSSNQTGFTKNAPIPLSEILKTERPDADFLPVGMDRLDPYHYPEQEMNHYRQTYRSAYKDISQIELITELSGEIYKQSIRYYMNACRSFRLNNRNMTLKMGRVSSLTSVFSMVVRPGGVVINTAPQDFQLQNILIRAGIQTIPLNADDPEFLNQLINLLKNQYVAAVYVRPQCSYPKGFTMKKSICEELIGLAQQYGFYIVEEDKYHEFWYGRRQYVPMARYPHNGHVVYIGVLSHLSLYMYNTRIIAAAEEIIERIGREVGESQSRDLLEERCIAEMIHQGDLPRLSKKVMHCKRDDRDLLFLQLDIYLSEYIQINKPECGLTFWLEFPKIPGLVNAMQFLEKDGILIPYHPDKPPVSAACTSMRLGFGTLKHEEAEAAAKLLQVLFKSAESV